MRVAYANLGAEEGRPAPAVGPVERLAKAWASLVDEPPWDWLAKAHGLVPWLSTDEAALEAHARQLPLWGSPPDVVSTVHDKAFAQRIAREHRIDPHLLEHVLVFDEGVTSEEIEAHVSTWPVWARTSFTAKPRFGTSGRGRIIGRNGRLLGRPSFGGKRRGGHQGGCIVEPWLDRMVDLSSLWFIDDLGAPMLLGTTRQVVRPSGAYLGCDIVADGGRLWSGSDHDDEMVEKAHILVTEAGRAGHRGPCGVDAFVYRNIEGDLLLRGAVELNARFTAGHVGLGLVMRLRQSGAHRFRLDTDEVLTTARSDGGPEVW